MTKQVLSSWRSSIDGTLVEQDLRVTYFVDDGSYELEASQEQMGISLNGDPQDSQYTVITKITDQQRLAKFLHLMNVGDLLVSINDKLVYEEGIDMVRQILETLVASGAVRKLKFINRKKISLQGYLRRLELKDQMTDLLGFVISMEDYLEEEKRRAQIASNIQQRDRDWVEYLKAIGGIENLKPVGLFKPSEDLKFMVRRGIPVAYRAAIWKKISLSSLLQHHQFPPNYYQNLLTRVKEIPPRVAEDIEKDVDRTFPQHIYFRHSGQGLASLRRVLQAFALHSPGIGYCQSLNFVVGMMLIFMDEEDAFFLLVTIVEQLLPSDYYTKSMVGTYVDQFVLAHIIKKFLPKIHSTLEENSLQLPLITVQWFMCIFVNTLRPEVTLRVWDMFLNEGNKVLFRIAAALFKLHETKLMAVRDAGDLFNTLRSIGSDITDPEILISTAYKSYIPSNARGAMKNILRNRGVSSPAASMKKVTSDNISPRLHPMTANGAVPKDLLGLGLAHLGPADALEKYRAASKSIDVKSSSSSSVSSKLSQEVSSSASAPASSSSTSGSVAAETSNSVPFLPSPPPVSTPPSGGNSPRPPTVHSDKHDQESIADAVDQFDPTFADPSLLFHNIGELGTGNGVNPSSGRHLFVGNNNSSAHKKKMERRQKKARSAQTFAFYRADLALWRSSFRPGLEERYKKMEMARNNWKKKNSIGVTSSPEQDLSEKFTPLVIEEETPVKTVPIRPGVIKDDDEDLDATSVSESQLSPSQRGSASGAARRPSFKDFLRRSFDGGEEGGNNADNMLDISDLKYNIDHAFVNTAAADELTKVKPTPNTGVAGTSAVAATGTTISRASVSTSNT